MASPNPDVLLVTASRVESSAVLHVFAQATGKRAEPGPKGDRVYFDLGQVGNTRVSLVQSEMGAGGLGAAAQTVQKGIEAVKPTAVIMVGIAFGIDSKKQAMGDILVATSLRLYEPQRVGTGTAKRGRSPTVLRGDRPRATPWLVNRFKSAELVSKGNGAQVRFGVMLTGEKLVDNLRFRDDLRRFEPEAIGGEMEGAGLYVACQDHKVDWILVKAISDWADGKKGRKKSSCQQTAARHAAEFVLHAFQFTDVDWLPRSNAPAVDDRSHPPGSVRPYADISAIEAERTNDRAQMTALAAAYYRRKGFRCVRPDGPVLAEDYYLPDQPIPLAKLDRRLEWRAQAPAQAFKTLDLAGYRRARTRSDGKLYDGFLYRVLRIENDKIVFCPGNYFPFLNSCEVLSYELADAIVSNSQLKNVLCSEQADRYDEAADFLCHHEELIPLRASSDPLAFERRSTAFGTCALVIIKGKRPNAAPQFLLNTRSHDLSETPGLSHVIPAGTFQPMFSDDRFHKQEFKLCENVFREFVEELLEDDHIRGNPEQVLTLLDAYGSIGRRFRNEVIDARAFTLLHLGMVVDPLNLKPEVLTALLIHEAVLGSCSPALHQSWETGEGTGGMAALFRHEFDRRVLQSLLDKEAMVPTGKFHVQLALRHFDYLAAAVQRI